MSLVLSLIHVLSGIGFRGAALKQQFNELINGKSQTNRNQISNLLFLQRLKPDWFKPAKNRQKESYKDIDIYYIGYITIKNIGDCEKICSVNPLYLIICKVDGHTEENNGNMYLIFNSTELHSTDENKEVLNNCAELWDGIKNKIQTINDGKKGKCGKGFIKIKFNTDDNLLLKKPLKIHLLTIIVRCIFQEYGKFYPQLYLNDCLYELCV